MELILINDNIIIVNQANNNKKRPNCINIRNYLINFKLIVTRDTVTIKQFELLN